MKISLLATLCVVLIPFIFATESNECQGDETACFNGKKFNNAGQVRQEYVDRRGNLEHVENSRGLIDKNVNRTAVRLLHGRGGYRQIKNFIHRKLGHGTHSPAPNEVGAAHKHDKIKDSLSRLKKVDFIRKSRPLEKVPGDHSEKRDKFHRIPQPHSHHQGHLKQWPHQHGPHHRQTWKNMKKNLQFRLPRRKPKKSYRRLEFHYLQGDGSTANAAIDVNLKGTVDIRMFVLGGDKMFGFTHGDGGSTVAISDSTDATGGSTDASGGTSGSGDTEGSVGTGNTDGTGDTGDTGGSEGTTGSDGTEESGGSEETTSVMEDTTA